MKKRKTLKQCLYKHRLIVGSILPRGFILWLVWCPQHETIPESSASFVHILLSLVSFLFSCTSLLTNTLLDQTRNFIFTRLLFLQRRICESRHLLFVEQKCRIFPLRWTKAFLQKPTGHTEGEAAPRRMFGTRS